MDAAQQRTMEIAALGVEKMALGGFKEQGAALIKMIESASVITDPNLGNKIDIFV